MGLLSDIVGIFSSIGKKKAIDRATSVQMDGLNRGLGAITSEGDRIQGLLAPYTNEGASAVGAESNLLGLSGDPMAQQSAIDQLQNSPLYQSLYRNGQEAVLQNGSATGDLRGGNIQHSLANFGSDTLAQVIQQQLQNLGGIAGRSLQATGQSGTFGQETAGGVASLQDLLGQTQAQGILGKAGVNQQLFGQGTNLFQDIISQIMGAGGGGSGGGITMGQTGSFI